MNFLNVWTESFNSLGKIHITKTIVILKIKQLIRHTIVISDILTNKVHRFEYICCSISFFRFVFFCFVYTEIRDVAIQLVLPHFHNEKNGYKIRVIAADTYHNMYVNRSEPLCKKIKVLKLFLS